MWWQQHEDWGQQGTSGPAAAHPQAWGISLGIGRAMWGWSGDWPCCCAAGAGADGLKVLKREFGGLKSGPGL